jgi:hypothetical protein
VNATAPTLPTRKSTHRDSGVQSREGRLSPTSAVHPLGDEACLNYRGHTTEGEAWRYCALPAATVPFPVTVTV